MLAVAAATLLSACGSSASGPNAGANAFEGAVRHHDASTACADMTAATARDMAEDALIWQRYSSTATASGCGGFVTTQDSGLELDALEAHKISNTSVHGATARVCFSPTGQPPGSFLCLALEHTGSRWLVNLTRLYNPVSEYALVTDLSSDTCIAAWNASTGEALPDLHGISTLALLSP